MYIAVNPKLPMRDKSITQDFYVGLLGFKTLGSGNFPEYLMLEKDQIELHFFLFRDLDPQENYGQVYIRTQDIQSLYQNFLNKHIPIHPNGPLQLKPWGQMEFSILDPDLNLLTFGERIT
ncbi:VOC family protein [Algoriphagus sp. CAU 1675]|uniref:bleomycin resistance protein n=1 Tax=Algoriphagus sp. CAU 1675 TaxID=3032597 RepID=UPI0023D9910B|nr:VOC family protein [Algoriphagus sp. CAU 1675]MDF2158337.1 VOC family protein [Algoriphagus sp. CAU 1675]